MSIPEFYATDFDEANMALQRFLIEAQRDGYIDGGASC